MALLRKLFYRKPPDGLLEICDRVYVFDCCFSTDGLEEEDYKVYMGGIVGQLRDQFPDASFMVFNFREGERQSQISDILSEYDMTVMDYPRHYEGCPLLTMEMIHHFLRSSESWLSLGQQNLLLMHCERGGWPVLAFMLAGLLLYRKQYTGEQKTLEMVNKQAPTELLQVLSPLNPQPSQLRYLQYISRRNVGSEWPPLDRALTLDCIMLRMIPNFDGEGGCRPIFRIYGQDPFIAADRMPKVLFSTPKKSKNVRLYKQADCELVKIDIHCHIQGDVVLECISLDDDLEREEMVFRVMFNTAFIRSNILMLNRDEIDVLWNAKNRFPKDFRAEVILSEMDAASSLITVDLGDGDEKEGLPMEAFTKVQEIFNHVDWLDSKGDAAHHALKQMTATRAVQEKLDAVSHLSMTIVALKREAISDTLKDELKSDAAEKKDKSSLCSDQKKVISCILKPSLDDELIKEKVQPQELIVAPESSPDPSLTKDTIQPLEELGALKPSSYFDLKKQKVHLQQLLFSLQHPGQTKIISQRIQTSLSNPVSCSSSMQGSPLPLSRYHSAPSALGITALLHDHTAYGSVGTTRPMKRPSQSPSLSVIGEPCLQEAATPNSAFSPDPPLLGPITTVAMDSPCQQQHQLASQPLSSLKHAHPMPGPPPPHIGISSPIGGGSSPNFPPLSPPSSCLGETLLFATNLDRTHSLQTLPCFSGFVTENNLSMTLLTPSPDAPSFGLSAPPSPLAPPSLASSTPSSLSAPPTFASSAPSSVLPSIGLALSTDPPPPPSPSPSTCASLAVSPACPLPTCASSTVPPPPLLSPFPSSSPPHSSSMFASSAVTPLPTFVSSTVPPPCLPSMFASSSVSPLIPAFASLIAPLPYPPPPITMVDSSNPPLPPPLPPPMATSSNLLHPPPQPPPMAASSNPPSCSPPPPPPSLSPPPPAPPKNPSTFSTPPMTKKLAIPSTPPPPPPPPIHSGVPRPALTLTPPPPPPPPLGSKAQGGPPSENPPNAPPIPPPAPGGLLGKGIGNIGVPPPAIGAGPPPFSLQFGVKGRGMKSQSTSKKTTLKPLHWIKVTRAMQGSLWAESQKNDEASKAPEFDMVELESLFSAAPSSDLSKKNEKSNRHSSRGPKLEKVHLIDLKRANNCEIMLSKVKMPLSDLMSTVLALDDTVLDADQVDNLIKYCPTKDEVELLKGYNGDKENLGRCEQFFLELLKVPRVESKLRVFSFKIQFTSQVSDLRNSLNIVNSTADEIRSSVKLKRIMQTILSLGNALNKGTARGSAIGFRLDSLLKLTDTRARNNKMTLMHYLCKVLSEKLPELLDFPKDLISLEAATKIQLKSLAEEMQAISKGLEKVEQELTASENDGPVSLTFRKMLKDFLVVAEAEVRSLTSLYSGVGRNADALAIYFGEDPARCPFEQVVSTLLNFVRMFVRAHEENRKQLEIEKKKAQKEAENEKMKISTPEKESEHFLRSPLRSGNIK